MSVQLLENCEDREIQEKFRLGTFIWFQWVSSELLNLLHNSCQKQEVEYVK